MEILSIDEFEGVFKTLSAPLIRKYLDTKTKKVFFGEKKIESSLLINYDLNHKILFKDCEFENTVIFKSRIKAREITFLNCKFNGTVSFEGGEFSGKIEFHECSFPKSTLSFNGGDFKDVSVYGGIIKGLQFFGGNFRAVKIGKYNGPTYIYSIIFNPTEVNGRISYYRVINFKFFIRGELNEKSSCEISECSIQEIVIYEFTNSGKFRLNRIFYNAEISRERSKKTGRENFINFEDEPFQDHSLFFVVNSVLYKAEFFSIDFTKYFKVSFRESSLIDIIISNIIWPKSISYFTHGYFDDISGQNYEIGDELEGHTDFRLIRENYRQLKYALSKQGDTVGEGYFHRLEMRAYNNSLSWKNDFGTKLILQLSHWTSNYGQSIFSPFVWLLGGHFILFAISLIFNGFDPLHISLSNHTSNGFKYAFEKYFIYINPLRKIETSLSGYLIVIDLFMRIWSSYMIYNIIRASRRFIK